MSYGAYFNIDKLSTGAKRLTDKGRDKDRKIRSERMTERVKENMYTITLF